MSTATQSCYSKTNHRTKLPGVQSGRLRGAIRGCGGFLPLLQYRSVMNTTVLLIGIFVVSKQKLNYTIWPQWYLCFSCTHPERKHRLHVFYTSVWSCSKRTVFNEYHAFCVCRPKEIGKYYRNLKSSSSCIYTCERLEKMSTKLSRGESSNAASPTAAAGGQGLMTACRGWGSCTLLETGKQKKSIKWEAKLRGEQNSFFQNAVSKEVYPEGCILQEWQTKWPHELSSVIFLFARFALHF